MTSRFSIPVDATLADDIYREVQAQYRMEDVLSRLGEQFPGQEFDDESVACILSIFDRVLGKNESYWESYWASIDAAINEFILGGAE